MSDLSKNLLTLRKENKLTQKQVSVVIFKSIETVRNYEKGMCEPSFKTLFILCSLFKTNPNEILGYEQI